MKLLELTKVDIEVIKIALSGRVSMLERKIESQNCSQFRELYKKQIQHSFALLIKALEL